MTASDHRGRPHTTGHVVRAAGVLLVAVVLAACVKDSDSIGGVPTAPLRESVQSAAGSRSFAMNWRDSTDEALWSSIVGQDSIALIAVKRPGAQRAVVKGRADLA